jgi:hypothetical protein
MDQTEGKGFNWDCGKNCNNGRKYWTDGACKCACIPVPTGCLSPGNGPMRSSTKGLRGKCPSIINVLNSNDLDLKKLQGEWRTVYSSDSNNWKHGDMTTIISHTCQSVKFEVQTNNSTNVRMSQGRISGF